MDFRTALREVLQEHGWAGPGQAELLTRWPKIIGPDIALRLPMVRFHDGQVVLQPDSPAWENQARVLTPMLMQRLNQEMGENVVSSIRVLKAQTGARKPLIRLDETTRVLHRPLQKSQNDEAVTRAVRRQSAAVPREPAHPPVSEHQELDQTEATRIRAGAVRRARAWRASKSDSPDA